MPDHIHSITAGEKKISEVLRFTKGIVARRIIDYLKNSNFTSSLEKLKQFEEQRGYKYSLWEHYSNAMCLTNEAMFMQKVNYIYLNLVQGNLVEMSDEYLYSSARMWKHNSLENEPLKIRVGEIEWRKAWP